ncbi:hypothetical protein [Streptomyces sp. NBC_01171]|uniref:hypothetical protein n=1 Tax=Streptomyces sp. NBC_01171 TaxID=2903757 RepID=UPI00386B1C68|nr:hypothetical protein OG448_00755 [Streptomyces sp. NBC_01171]
MRTALNRCVLAATTPDAVLPGVTRLLGGAESAAAPCPVHGRVRLSARSQQVPHVR